MGAPQQLQKFIFILLSLPSGTDIFMGFAQAQGNRSCTRQLYPNAVQI